MACARRRRAQHCALCVLIGYALALALSALALHRRGLMGGWRPVNATQSGQYVPGGGPRPVCAGFGGNATDAVPVGAGLGTMWHVARRLDDAGLLAGLRAGGGYEPAGCRPRWRVAIVVPFRGRQPHLRLLLCHLHEHLRRQSAHYRVFVVHQAPGQTFNRAKLMNVGYAEVAKLRPHFDCFVFHDVDLLPVTMGLPYDCSRKGPLHMVPALDKFNWSLPYGTSFGGVCALSNKQMAAMNGFSNLYWGWGGEDDDAWIRIDASGQKAARLPADLGRFAMIRHQRDRTNVAKRDNGRLLSFTRAIWMWDGLNSLSYKVVDSGWKESKVHSELLVDLLPDKSATLDELVAVHRVNVSALKAPGR